MADNNLRKLTEFGVGIGIGIEDRAMKFGHERLNDDNDGEGENHVLWR